MPTECSQNGFPFHGLFRREEEGQRDQALALGYEDLNDHDDLREDSLLAMLVGKIDPTVWARVRERDAGKPLAQWTKMPSVNSPRFARLTLSTLSDLEFQLESPIGPLRHPQRSKHSAGLPRRPRFISIPDRLPTCGKGPHRSCR
jgi:hypothetical protein